MSIGVRRDTTRLMGIRASRREAWVAVRGKPSRMKEAEGRGEGAADTAEVGASQFLERSLARIRRRIISSGTRLPCLMADSASSPKPGQKELLDERKGGEGGRASFFFVDGRESSQ